MQITGIGLIEALMGGPAIALALLSDAPLYTITASLLRSNKPMSVRVQCDVGAKIHLLFVPYFVVEGSAVVILRESVTRMHRY